MKNQGSQSSRAQSRWHSAPADNTGLSFLVGPPLTDWRDFYGRGNERKALADVFRSAKACGGHGHNAATVIGPMRYGKTTLSLQFARDLRTDSSVRPLVAFGYPELLCEAPGRLRTDWLGLQYQLLGGLLRQVPETLKAASLRELRAGDFAAVLGRISERQSKPIVLIIDEASRLQFVRGTDHSGLRTLVDELHRMDSVFVTWILPTGRNPPGIQRSKSPAIVLQPLDDEDAYQLLTQSKRSLSMPYLDRQLAKEICRDCGGHPMIIAAIGQAMLLRARRHRADTFDRATYAAARRTDILDNESTRKWLFSEILGGCWSTGPAKRLLAALAAIATNDYVNVRCLKEHASLSDEDLFLALTHLEQQHVIDRPLHGVVRARMPLAVEAALL